MPLPHQPLGRVAAVLLLLGAAACSSDDEPVASEETTETAETETTETTPDEETETTEGSEPGQAGEAGAVPEWALGYETRGELLTTLEGEGFQVDVYQVGTTAATKDGQFVDPETNKPLVATGDEVVFVNYVFTNTSNEPINLPYSLVSVDAVYDDWPYLQGMDGVVDDALFEQMGVLDEALRPGGDADFFVWEPGTSFAYGENFKYQPGSGIAFSATLTPTDDSGDMLHDQRQEVEAEATIA